MQHRYPGLLLLPEWALGGNTAYPTTHCRIPMEMQDVRDFVSKCNTTYDVTICTWYVCIRRLFAITCMWGIAGSG